MNYFKFSVKQLVATVAGAALFFLLARFLSFPTPFYPDTYLALQYAVIGAFAAVFGPIAGLLIGLIGHALTDFTSFGWGGIWWSWVVASAVTGLLSGFLLKPGRVSAGYFSKVDALRFILGSLVIHAICWCVIAPGLDILIYSEPADRVFQQGIITGIGNFIVTAIIGALILLGYASTRVKPDDPV